MGIEERSPRTLVFNLRLTLEKEENAKTIRVLQAVPPRRMSATVRALLEYAVQHLGDEARGGCADDSLEELTPEVWRAINRNRRDNLTRENGHAQVRNP